MTPIPIPDDFAQQWQTMCQQALAEHFGVSRPLVRRWTRILGLVRPNTAKVTRYAQDRARAAPKLMTHHKATAVEVWRDNSAAGEAQRILQGDKWVVYRCDETGRQSQGGKLWRCGEKIVTDAELIERAGRVSARNQRKVA